MSIVAIPPIPPEIIAAECAAMTSTIRLRGTSWVIAFRYTCGAILASVVWKQIEQKAIPGLIRMVARPELKTGIFK